MRDVVDTDTLVIDSQSAGDLPQPFEQHHKNNVIVFNNKVELRQMETMGPRKYVTHTETFKANTGSKIDPDAFLEAFKRAHKADSVDVRKTIKWALKGSYILS